MEKIFGANFGKVNQKGYFRKINDAARTLILLVS